MERKSDMFDLFQSFGRSLADKSDLESKRCGQGIEENSGVPFSEIYVLGTTCGYTEEEIRILIARAMVPEPKK